MRISKYYLGFLFFSIAGWLYECLYVILATGLWENRGFLYGPVCPIYGVGALLIILLFKSARALWKIRLHPAEIFIVSAVGSALLEYSASWGMERLFHARWWDYGDMPLNLNGRICLPAALLFGVFGILIIKKIMPAMDMIFSHMPNALIEVLTIASAAVLSADFTLTVSRFYF